MTRVLLSVIALLGFCFLALPLAIVIRGGLTDGTALSWPFHGYTLRSIETVLNDSDWSRAIWLSCYLAAATALAATILGTAAAVGLSRSRSRMAAVLREALLAPLILPTIVLGAAFLQISAAVGLMQSFAAILIGHVVIAIPFVLQSTLPLLSRDFLILEEASADLGAGPFSTLFRVTLPLIHGGIITGAIYAFIFSFTNVEMSLFQATSDLVTLPVKLYNYVQYQVDATIAAVSALTIVAAALCLIFIDLFFGLTFIPRPTAKK